MPDDGAALPRVLLVDDEPAVLSSLTRTLRGRCQVAAYHDPLAALDSLVQAVEQDQAPAVVISDMQMPGLDGATLLARARSLAPDTSRLLLTGQSDLESAVRAVNDGGIFRFLQKPCLPEVMLGAVEAAVRQHELVTAERVLLEQTLKGAVAALADVLALADPRAFGLALRVKRRATALARAAGTPWTWELDVAFQLAHIGLVGVPGEVLDALERGWALGPVEERALAKVPDLSARLLQGVPRLEGVVAAVAASGLRFDGRGTATGGPAGEGLPVASRLLKVATDLERASSTGMALDAALAVLAADDGCYDPSLLAAAAGASQVRVGLQLLDVDRLELGMVIAADVRSTTEVLLISRGSRVTAGVVERLGSAVSHGTLRGRVVVEGAVSG